MLHDILVDLLPKVDLRVRRQLSEQLGAMQKPPAELLSLLVHDVIEVAGPLLEHAAVSDEDLIDVVKVGDDAHREKISRRPQLHPQVRDALEKYKTRKKNAAANTVETFEAARNDTPIKAEAAPPPVPATGKTADAGARTEDFAIANIIGEARLFEDIIRSAVDWTWEIGRDGDVTYLSDSAIRAFGRPPRTLTGFQFVDYCSLANTTGRYNNMQDVLDQMRPFRNLTVLTRDTADQQRTWRLSGVPCFDLYSGRFTGFRGTAQEALDRRADDHLAPYPEAPEKDGETTASSTAAAAGVIRRPPPKEVIISPAARNMDKGAAELIQTLSHELRTPLNAILGFSEMIDHEAWGPVSTKYHDKTKVILRSAHNLKNVITDVLDVAKIRAGKQHVAPKFFSLAATLRTSLQAVEKEAQDQGVILSPLQLAPDVPMLNDPEYLGRCIVKMLTYVVTRAKNGDNLWMTARRSANHRVDIDIPLLGPSEDRRPASSNDQSAKLPGETTSLAFGLSVAADLAQAIGGEIRLITQNDQADILRLTIGDYPAIPPREEK